MGFFISETLDSEQRRSIHPATVIRVYISAILHKRLPALVLCLSLSFAGVFLYIAGAPSVMYNFLGLGSDDFGWLFVPIVAGLMLGAAISGQLAHRWPSQRTISVGMMLMILASGINIIVANLAEATILTVVGPLVLYVVGVSVMMPAITVLALDCLPTHRGTAASMQGFLQMMTNAGVASLAVPFLNASWLNFVYGQLVFLLFAVGLWFRLGRIKN
jgi:DHA1 family bicyclomycin/chloramphenicol resistance-like MFS transporter